MRLDPPRSMGWLRVLTGRADPGEVASGWPSGRGLWAARSSASVGDRWRTCRTKRAHWCIPESRTSVDAARCACTCMRASPTFIPVRRKCCGSGTASTMRLSEAAQSCCLVLVLEIRLAHPRTEAAVPLCVVCQPKSNVSNRMFRRSNTSAYITASDHWSTGERSIFAVDGSLIDPH